MHDACRLGWYSWLGTLQCMPFACLCPLPSYSSYNSMLLSACPCSACLQACLLMRSRHSLSPRQRGPLAAEQQPRGQPRGAAQAGAAGVLQQGTMTMRRKRTALMTLTLMLQTMMTHG